jgi:hypothetical protein
MSQRSYLFKSAAVISSVLLVSAYIYLRTDGEFVTAFPHSEVPVGRAKFMLGPKSSAVFADRALEREGSHGATKGTPNKSTRDLSPMLIPSTKSAVIFSLGEARSADTGATAQRP